MATMCEKGDELRLAAEDKYSRALDDHLQKCQRCRGACIETCSGCGATYRCITRDCGCPAGSGLALPGEGGGCDNPKCTECQKRKVGQRERVLVLAEIAERRRSPRDVEKDPPKGLTSRQARIAVQQLLDQGTLKLDDRLKLATED